MYKMVSNCFNTSNEFIFIFFNYYNYNNTKSGSKCMLDAVNLSKSLFTCSINQKIGDFYCSLHFVGKSISRNVPNLEDEVDGPTLPLVF